WHPCHQSVAACAVTPGQIRSLRRLAGKLVVFGSLLLDLGRSGWFDDSHAASCQALWRTMLNSMSKLLPAASGAMVNCTGFTPVTAMPPVAEPWMNSTFDGSSSRMTTFAALA